MKNKIIVIISILLIALILLAVLLYNKRNIGDSYSGSNTDTVSQQRSEEQSMLLRAIEADKSNSRDTYTEFDYPGDELPNYGNIIGVFPSDYDGVCSIIFNKCYGDTVYTYVGDLNIFYDKYPTYDFGLFTSSNIDYKIVILARDKSRVIIGSAKYIYDNIDQIL